MMLSVTSSNEQHFGVIFVYWWCTRAPRSKQKHQKFKSIKNVLVIHQSEALGELFPMSTILVSFWCIDAALEHQKVKNHLKLKCSKNLIYQIVPLGELMKINTTKWRDFGIGWAKNGKKKKKQKCRHSGPEIS